jgi:hypothetical protein
VARNQPAWQSKLVLLMVVPGVAALVVLETPWWAAAQIGGSAPHRKCSILRRFMLQ